jgi:uncharacterized delta-60 repeat protein
LRLEPIEEGHVRLSVDLDTRRARVALRGTAVLAAAAAIGYPAWLAGSQLPGLIVFSPGQMIKAADFNSNFAAIEAAHNDTDAKVTTLAGQVAPLPGQVGTLQGQVGTLQGQLTTAQGQIGALQAQNATLNGRLNALQALTFSFGVPDATFGNNGVALQTGLSVGAVAMDPNGNILVTGYEAPLTATSHMVLERFLPTGQLDPQFNATGAVPGVVTSAGGGAALGEGLALDASGNILVAGTSGVTTVWRFTSGGAVDTSFAGGLGYATVADSDGGNAVAIDGSGGILVAGTTIVGGTTPAMALWRFISTGAQAGTLDGTYGTGGAAVDPSVPGTYLVSYGQALAVDSTGRGVVGGVEQDSAATLFMSVWRFDTSGHPDGTFNTTGQYVYTAASSSSAIALDASGRILSAGYTGGAASAMAVWRLETKGTLDPSFGAANQGIVTSMGFGGTVEGTGLAFDAAGRVVVGGDSNGLPTIWRLNPNGALDATFGSGAGYGGNPNVGSLAAATGVLIDPTGKIVIAGTTSNNLAVFRFD